MMTKPVLLFAALLLFPFQAAIAQQYSVEQIGAASEAEGVSDEIAQLISEQGFRVKKGTKRTVCELWLRKDLPIKPDFETSPTLLYPFTEGQLVGLLHYPRRGSEFRDQQVSSGWYTLRFALQPVDGNHVGTSPTRDFVLLVDAASDEFAENWDEKQLHEASAEVAGSSHPAMLCFQRPSDGTETEVIHNESTDWWVLHLIAKCKAGDETKDLPIDLVVVGHAEE